MLTDSQIIELLVDTKNSISVEIEKNNIKNTMSLVNNYRSLKSLLSTELTKEFKTTLESDTTYFQELLNQCTEMYNQSLTDREIRQSNELVRLIRSIDNLLRESDNIETI